MSFGAKLWTLASGPWLLQTLDSFEELVAQIKSHTDPDAINVVVLGGSAMPDADAFYNELIEKLKLPDYFGRNLNALDECVTDPEWLEGKALVVIIREAELMLKDHRKLFEGFVDAMRDAGEKWSKAVAEKPNGIAQLFHFILFLTIASWKLSRLTS